MSHIVKVKTNMNNVEHLKLACERLGLSYELNSSAKLYSGSSYGTVIRLPGWTYPIVVKSDGEVSYDNYGGTWGNIGELNKLRQTYAAMAMEELLQLSGMVVESTTDKNGQLIMVAREGW